MLVARIITCFLTIIACFVVRKSDENNRTLIRNIFAVGAVILGITFCVLLITTNLNWLIIAKIPAFILFCLYLLFPEDYFNYCNPFVFCIKVTVILFVIAVMLYATNLEECEVPDVSTTSRTIVCAKDNSSVTGSISGSILYIEGSVSERSVYQYYYQLEDGGIKQGTIPAELTTIYFVEAGKEPHLETVVTTKYWKNNNNSPPTRYHETSEITYELYVPKGSITNIYRFDAE